MATYYVKNGGSDGASGLSDALAWETVAKVNGFSFAAGDSVLFKRGSTWRESLTVPRSGTAGNPMIFGAYDTGAKPVFLGSLDLSATGDWTASAPVTEVTVGPYTPAASADDGYGADGGDFDNLTVGSIRLGNEGASIKAGVRFIGVNLPQGATIASAVVTFHSHSELTGTTVNVTIKGEDNATPAAFATDMASYNARTRTTASVAWNNLASSGGYGTDYAAPDVADIIEEIVGREDWVAGGNITLFFEDNSSTANAYRRPLSWDAEGTSQAAQLSITYTLVGAIDVWKTSATHTTIIGGLFFNDDALVGMRKATINETLAQGDFYYSEATDLIYLRSVSNPGTFYSNIEASQFKTGVQMTNKSYITVENLALKYFACHGVQTTFDTGTINGICVQYCDISYIGGGTYPGSTIRFGNGVEAYGIFADFIVRYNTISHCFDVGMTTQQAADVLNLTGSGHYFYGNVVSKCQRGFTTFIAGTGNTLNGLYVCHNVFYDMGGGWNAGQETLDARAFYAQLSPSTLTNQVFKNNIIYGTDEHLMWFDGTDAADQWAIDYNCYYPDGAAMFATEAGETNFAGWQTATGQDANSFIDDPAFRTLGTDFHLTVGSPCVDTGVVVANVGQAIVGAAPDMGVYELPLEGFFKLCPFRKV